MVRLFEILFDGFNQFSNTKLNFNTMPTPQLYNVSTHANNQQALSKLDTYIIVICIFLYTTQDIDLPGLATLTQKEYQSYVLLKVNLNVLDKWMQLYITVIPIFWLFY